MDIHKAAFQAGSSGLYKFTRMPFGLLNVTKFKTTVCDNELVFSQVMIGVISSIC